MLNEENDHILFFLKGIIKLIVTYVGAPGFVFFL